jgi:hypothetical protein
MGPRGEAREQTVLHQGKDRKLVFKLAAKTLVDCIIGPCVQLGVPCRAVIESHCRDPAETIVWPE